LKAHTHFFLAELFILSIRFLAVINIRHFYSPYFHPFISVPINENILGYFVVVVVVESYAMQRSKMKKKVFL
jgi:hypothetical protein